VNRQIGVEEFKYGVTGDPVFTGGEGVTWPNFGIWDPLYNSGTVQATNFKFGMNIDHEGALTVKIQK